MLPRFQNGLHNVIFDSKINSKILLRNEKKITDYQLTGVKKLKLKARQSCPKEFQKN